MISVIAKMLSDDGCERLYVIGENTWMQVADFVGSELDELAFGDAPYDIIFPDYYEEKYRDFEEQGVDEDEIYDKIYDLVWEDEEGPFAGFKRCLDAKTEKEAETAVRSFSFEDGAYSIDLYVSTSLDEFIRDLESADEFSYSYDELVEVASEYNPDEEKDEEPYEYEESLLNEVRMIKAWGTDDFNDACFEYNEEHNDNY